VLHGWFTIKIKLMIFKEFSLFLTLNTFIPYLLGYSVWVLTNQSFTLLDPIQKNEACGNRRNFLEYFRLCRPPKLDDSIFLSFEGQGSGWS